MNAGGASARRTGHDDRVIRRGWCFAALASVLTVGMILYAPPGAAVELKQATRTADPVVYRFDDDEEASIPVLEAPADTDWRRWAMLHDGTRARLYAFRSGTVDELYPFAYDEDAGAFRWRFDSTDMIEVVGAPATADSSRFAMLHDGQTYRLYMPDSQDQRILHQFAFDSEAGHYAYGHRSAPRVYLNRFPRDADHGRLAMLHDGTDQRAFLFLAGRHDFLVQGAFDAEAGEFRYGFRSEPRLRLDELPADANTSAPAMLFDGEHHRLYLLGH